jgi:hypothetical protein
LTAKSIAAANAAETAIKTPEQNKARKETHCTVMCHAPESPIDCNTPVEHLSGQHNMNGAGHSGCNMLGSASKLAQLHHSAKCQSCTSIIFCNRSCATTHKAVTHTCFTTLSEIVMVGPNPCMCVACYHCWNRQHELLRQRRHQLHNVTGTR